MAFVDGGISVDSSYAMIPISGDTAMTRPDRKTLPAGSQSGL